MSREMIQEAQDRIDQLNTEKSGLQKAWEGECERLGDPELAKPVKLKALNRELFSWYSRRDDLLKMHPEFQSEFGTPGRKKNKQKSFSVTQAAITSADRAHRKQDIHQDFKAWCAEQRPQVKASLENWESDAVRERFFRDRIAPEGFEAWCTEVEKRFCYTTWRGRINQVAFAHWEPFKTFCLEMGFPTVVANFRNHDIRAAFDAWRVERDVRLAEEDARRAAEAKAAEVRAEEQALADRYTLLPPRFPVFAELVGGIGPSDTLGKLHLWEDEEARALFAIWEEQLAQDQKAS